MCGAIPSIRGACLWGNHSPTMWPDVSMAEGLTEDGWVPIEELIGARVSGDVVTRLASDGVGARKTELTSAGKQWVAMHLVPALRSRWGSRSVRSTRPRGKAPREWSEAGDGTYTSPVSA